MARNKTKLTPETHDNSLLDRAIDEWRTAWHRLDMEPGWDSIHRYNFATLKLEAAYWRDRSGASGFGSEFETFRRRLIQREQN